MSITAVRAEAQPGRMAMFNAMRYPNYRLFWIGQLSSILGQNMQHVAQYWLVLQLTGSPLMLGLTGLSQAIPSIGFTLVGGVVADRADRQKVLKFAQAIQALLYASLATLVVTDVVEVWHIMSFAFLTGIIRAFDQPSRQALLPHLIPREELANAVALSSTVWQLSRLTGPAVAGALIALFGVGQTFYVASLGFVIFLCLLYFIRLDKPLLRSEGKGLMRDALEGLDFIRRNEIFYTLIGMTFFNSVFGMSYAILMPVFARDIFNVGSGGYGVLQSVGGVGALAGTLMVAYMARSKRRGWQAIVGATGFGILLIGFAFSPWYLLSLGIVLLMGLMNQFYMTTINTVLQMRLPDEFRGRVMGVYGLTWSLMPLGGTVSGAVAQFYGARVAVGSGGFLVAAMALVVAVALPRVRRLE